MDQVIEAILRVGAGFLIIWCLLIGFLFAHSGWERYVIWKKERREKRRIIEIEKKEKQEIELKLIEAKEKKEAEDNKVIMIREKRIRDRIEIRKLKENEISHHY